MQFTDTKLDSFHEQEQLWFNLNKAVNHCRDQISSVNEDGWISNEQYNDAIQKVAELKASLVASAEGDEGDICLLEKGWLFRDRERLIDIINLHSFYLDCPIGYNSFHSHWCVYPLPLFIKLFLT